MREAVRDNTTGRHTATNDRDEALFRSLQRKKRARRRRVIRTVMSGGMPSGGNFGGGTFGGGSGGRPNGMGGGARP